MPYVSHVGAANPGGPGPGPGPGAEGEGRGVLSRAGSSFKKMQMPGAPMVRSPDPGDQGATRCILFDHSDGCGALAVLCQATKPTSHAVWGMSKPYITLCLLNYDALHLTDFVGGVHRRGQLVILFTIACCRQLLLTVILCRQR